MINDRAFPLNWRTLLLSVVSVSCHIIPSEEAANPSFERNL
jgi:hypothetical protein